MPADSLVTIPGSGAAPLSYTVAQAQVMLLKAGFATFNGASATGSFLPCMRILAPGGQTVGEYIASTTVAAGGSADVSFGPFLDNGSGSGSGELDFQLNDQLIATEPAIDFENGGGITWAINDDPTNHRAKVSAIVQTSDAAPTAVLTQVAAIDNSGDFAAFGTVAVLATGNLISAWSDGPTEAQDATVSTSTSTDGGATWAAETVLETPSVGHTFNGPVGITVLNTGRVYVTYFEAINGFVGPAISGHFTYSDDNGGTFTSPGTLSLFSNWTASGGRVLQLASGRLIWPVYGRNLADTKDRCGIVYSDDGGVTWSAFVSVSGNGSDENLNELALIQTPNGLIVGAMRTDDNAFYYRVTSSDNGLTWTAKSNMGFSAEPGYPELILEPDTQVTMMPYRQHTTEFAVYRLSSDYGVTWASEVLISSLVQEYAGGVHIATNEIGFGLGLKLAANHCDWWFYTARITANRATKIIAGSVEGNGTIDRGRGFSVVRHAAGKYSITFDTPFTVAPVVNVSAWSTAGNVTNNATANLGALGGAVPTITGFDVWTTDPPSVNIIDTGFDFEAIVT